MPDVPFRSFMRLLVLASGAGVLGYLLLTHPPLVVGDPAAWTADDTALVACWSAAVAFSSWLTLVTSLGAVAATPFGSPIAPIARRYAPRFVRRLIEGALVVSVTAPIGALPAQAAVEPPTVVVHVQSDGRLGSGAVDEPVVRHTPGVAPTTVTSVPRPPATTARTTPTTAPRTTPTTTPRSTPRTAPTSVPPTVAESTTPPVRRSAPRAAAADRHLVRAGDNLWSIASERLGAGASDAQVASYWRRLVAVNRPTLRSGDPNLIFPGEIVTLPAIVAN